MNRVKSFEEIDKTYAKYLTAVSGNNNESQIDTLTSQIIEEIWCNLHSNHKFKKLLDDFPDEMIDVCKYWIKKYSTNNDYHGFSACTFRYIEMRLNTCAAEKAFDDSTAGMHVTDEYKRTQNKLKQLYKSFALFRKSVLSEEELNNKFVDYALEHMNIDRSIVIDFLNPKKATRIEKNNSEDDSYDITDIFGGSNTYSPEKIFEQNESNNEILSKINDEWNKQKEDSKLLMSELLTLSIIEAIEKNYLNIESTSLEPYSFINRKMMKVYFFNHDEEIPTKQQIGEKYKLTKSGVSKKLSRFFEKIKN